MRVYPGLAVYKTLLIKNPDQEIALATMEILFRKGFFEVMLFGIHLLAQLPDPFPTIRPVLKMSSRSEYLPGSQEVIEDSPNCYALNTYRCYILETLKAYDAAELTGLFCKTDDWLTEALPRITWERTKTLARGDDFCNFRWSRQI